MSQCIPPGFEPYPPASAFMAQFGPLSVRFRDDGIDLGLVVGAKHLNHQGVVHGGVVASMADTVMAFHSARAAGYAVATVSMNIDYLAAVREGSWMEVRSRIDRKGSRMVFVACDGVVDETPAFRASAVFSAVRVRSVA